MPQDLNSRKSKSSSSSPSDDLLSLLQKLKPFPVAGGITTHNPIFTPPVALTANPILAFLGLLTASSSLNSGEKEFLQQQDTRLVEDMVNEVISKTGGSSSSSKP